MHSVERRQKSDAPGLRRPAPVRGANRIRIHSRIVRLRGFTLLEVLIALAVLALALTALVRAAGLSANDFAGLRERSLAGWVAANVITETRLAPNLPAPGRSDGKLHYAGRDWRWELTVQDTPEAGIRRLDVRVFVGEEREAASATLSGFVGDVVRP